MFRKRLLQFILLTAVMLAMAEILYNLRQYRRSKNDPAAAENRQDKIPSDTLQEPAQPDSLPWKQTEFMD